MRLALVPILLASSSAALAMDIPSARKGELREFVTQDCGSCHGMTRAGGLGSPLVAEQLKDIGDEALVATILEGRPGTPMPPWRGLLSEDEALWIVRHLKGDAP